MPVVWRVKVYCENTSLDACKIAHKIICAWLVESVVMSIRYFFCHAEVYYVTLCSCELLSEECWSQYLLHIVVSSSSYDTRLIMTSKLTAVNFEIPIIVVVVTTVWTSNNYYSQITFPHIYLRSSFDHSTCIFIINKIIFVNFWRRCTICLFIRTSLFFSLECDGNSQPWLI